ncbi:diguanylate phosphodiesterase [Mycobacterium sp. Root265]|uniref:putative bifunctional diguanylate cyclase/phosphodiesterase n=1 Tax=Mycobacterium sp. Root265 TaxID=1736504 RepID=UPI00070CF190|nr:bifunctional diguanylate cyclase/phosphodiesterase [Mycobacterium sp. Root265]KRD14236.1 diguanylate phosphodiesterase [Mycobacterium sp. Root265]
MTVGRSRLRLLVLAGVITLAAVNAMAFWGDSAADTGALILQICAGVGAIVCGLTVARREHGTERWWRLVFVAALVNWALGQTLWQLHMADWAPVLARIVYLSIPVLVFTSVVLLVRSSGGVTAPPDSPLRQPFVTNALDGVIAGLAFLILAVMSDLGTRFAASSTHMRVLDVIFIGAEIFVVGTVVLIAMIYDPSRPNRTNYLLLAGGLLMMGTANRLLAYLRSVDMTDAELWVGIGLIVGPVLTGFAFLPTAPPSDSAFRRQDWPQLLLPYVGFLGIAVLFTFHLYIERELSLAAVVLAVAMVALVATRQVLATRAERSLTQWLYWAQRGLAHQVHHDALTGLPNRTLFAQRLDEAMRHGQFVLIFIDLDDFKEVNDRYGHAAGDELLCAVGDRLGRFVADGDTLARIGGDEFAILIRGAGDQGEQLEGSAERLRIALREPFPVHGSSLRVQASMGLVRPESDGLPQTSDDLLRQADIAMYAGKRMGKDTAVVYQPSSGAVVDFPTLLRASKGRPPPGFRLVYQPVVALGDGTPVAVEALSRWTAANGIDISAETFVADTEAAGLGADFDALVLDLACSEVRGRGLDLDIHVNIGGARLGNPGFEQTVRNVLERYRIPRERLVLEITETMPIVDLDRAARQIGRFGEMGVKVALDDFGSGFSSLTYLHALPVGIVKLDRSLASGSNPARDQTLYRSVIKLCDDLGLDVIAEGVETAEQAEMVARAGGRLAQGHLFGMPVPVAELVASLATVQGQA